MANPVVLAVDDNPGILYANRRLLERSDSTGGDDRPGGAGQGARTARSRPARHQAARHERLRGLPEAEVDPATASIPVLHLTATYGAGEEQAAALEGGADAYLTHPLGPIVLVATIRSLLRGRAAESRARQVTAWWQTTFDALGDGVMLLDNQAQILRCNKAMARLLAGTAEELRARRAPELPGAGKPPEGGLSSARSATGAAPGRGRPGRGAGTRWWLILFSTTAAGSRPSCAA